MIKFKELLELSKKTKFTSLLIFILIYLSFGILFSVVYSVLFLSYSVYKSRKAKYFSANKE